jgi:hypothetical protein
VRRSADPGLAPPHVLDADGRAAPFDGRRLAASIRRALAAVGPGTEADAEDLAGAVGAFLRQRAGAASVSSDVLAGFVIKVLEGGGHGEAGRLYARSRRREQTAVGARVRLWLEQETDLAPTTAQQIAAEVEGGVHAAGLQDPGAGLLREWVDHALRRRGQPDALGLQPTVGLSGHELRSLLAAGPPGVAAELRAGTALLARHALHGVLPPDAGAGHTQGLVDFGGLAAHTRVHGLCVAPFRQPEVRAARAACRVAVAGALLRELAGLVAYEVRVLWDGPAPRGDDRLQLELQLRQPADAGAQIVLCVPAAEPARVRPWLRWEALGGVCRLRLCGPVVHGDLLAEVAARPGSLEIALQPPPEGIVLGAAAVNLLRPALESPDRQPGSYLDAVEGAAALAAAGLAAWEAQGPGAAAREHVLERLDADVEPPLMWWLETAGLVQARIALIGAGARARQNGRDFAVAVGDRLRRGWARRAPLSTDPTSLRLVPAGVRTQQRFRRLDLPLRADVPLASSGAVLGGECQVEPLGEGESFAHDGEADPLARGREVAALRRCLGVAAEAAAPRKAGDPVVREAFLRAFLEPSLDAADIVPCA